MSVGEFINENNALFHALYERLEEDESIKAESDDIFESPDGCQTICVVLVTKHKSYLRIVATFEKNRSTCREYPKASRVKLYKCFEAKVYPDYEGRITVIIPSSNLWGSRKIIRGLGQIL